MGRNIKDFVADWHVWYVDGPNPVLQRAYRLAIGTEPGTEPFLGEEGHPSVGFLISQEDGTPVFSSREHGPLVLMDGTLRWVGTGTDTILKRIYVSLAESVSKDDLISYSLYGTTLHGDPEQVAVWGANDGPPPPEPGAA
ncbi:MAG: hypothetical protein ACJ759_13490 [Thermoanaerobaculia bacterium]